MNWFKQNSLKANLERFQTMLISSHGCDVDGLMMNVQNTTISPTERMKVLGVKIDNKLNFTEHITDVCINADRQLNVLQRLKRVLDYKSRMAIYKSFIMSIVCFTSLMASLIRSVGGLLKYFYQALWLVDLNAEVIGQPINRRGVA